MKWAPFTVTSRWLDQERQNSRWAFTSIAPGSALTNSLGKGLADSHAPYWFTISTTSGGSPSNGISLGQVSVGRRDSPGTR